jgi:hypothetical protein
MVAVTVASITIRGESCVHQQSVSRDINSHCKEMPCAIKLTTPSIMSRIAKEFNALNELRDSV